MNKSNNAANIKASLSNLWSCATTTLAVSTEVLADVTGIAVDAIAATPEVVAATANLHKATRSGYRQETHGLTEAEADKESQEFFDVSIAHVVTKVGKGAGKLTSQLFADASTDANNADTKES